MKIATIAAGLLVGAAVSPALAADFETAFSDSGQDWTGLHLGLQGGFAFVDFGFQNTEVNDATADDSSAGIFVGFRGGYDRQFGAVVVGVLGDVELVSVDGRGQHSLDPNDFVEFSLDWMAMAGGRIGTPVGSSLLYALAGIAVTDLDHTYTIPNSDAVVSYPDETMVGWTVGLGVERMFAGNWSAFVEGRYADFGSVDVEALGFNVDHRLDLSLFLLKFGVSQRW